MPPPRSDRRAVEKASRSYYTKRAFYLDLFAERKPRDPRTRKELAFLERAFRTHATRPVRRILDVACGGGRHTVGLAQRGYACVAQDFTPDRVEATRRRAERAKVSVRLAPGDATRLPYSDEFDAVLALYVLFLLPSDRDAQTAIRQARRALRPGGVFVCNVFNPLSLERSGSGALIHREPRIGDDQAPGIRMLDVTQLRDFDPVHGWGWAEETSVIEAPDGPHVFRDRERLRFFTYWDMLHMLEAARFRDIECYPDWTFQRVRRPAALQLVFTARK